MTQQQYMRFYLAVQDVRASGYFVRQNAITDTNRIAGFHIEGRETATPLTITLARDLMAYARNTLKIKSAQIINSDGNVVDSYTLSGAGSWQEPITRSNQHRIHEYRGLRIIEDRAFNPPKFHHRFVWPLTNGAERSISSDSLEGIVERLRELGGTIPEYVRMFLDRVEPPVAEAASEAQSSSDAPPETALIYGVPCEVRDIVVRKHEEPPRESLPSEVVASRSLDPHAFFLKVARLTEHGSKD